MYLQRAANLYLCRRAPPRQYSTMNDVSGHSAQRQLWTLMLAAGAILLITMGARQTSGLFLIPITQSTGVSIVAMSFALAVGQFMFGAAQPVFGAIADKYGAVKVVVAGAIMLALGCALTPLATSSLGLLLTMGVLSAAGAAAGSFSILIGIAAQRLPPEKRSFAAGHHQCRRLDRTVRVRAARAAHHRRGGLGERDVRDGVRRAADDSAGAAAATFGRGGRGAAASLAPVPHLTLGEQLRVALRDPSYLYLHAGFFTCGFHIAFLVTHLPNDLRLCGLRAGGRGELADADRPVQRRRQSRRRAGSGSAIA